MSFKLLSFYSGSGINLIKLASRIFNWNEITQTVNLEIHHLCFASAEG
jgi:hypothetical protein